MAYTYNGVRYDTYAEASAALRAANPPRQRGARGGSSGTTEPETETEPEEDPNADTVGAVGSLIPLTRPGALESRVIQKHWLYSRNIIRPRRAWM